MENPIFQWMIWGENPPFKETPIYTNYIPYMDPITRWWFQKNMFYFHPYLGKIPILTSIFQRGWFNHQSDMHGSFKGCSTLLLCFDGIFGSPQPASARRSWPQDVDRKIWRSGMSGGIFFGGLL